jgi:hypothetical protein
MMQELIPIQMRAKDLKDKPGIVDHALASGADKCKAMARETMAVVRDRMGID